MRAPYLGGHPLFDAEHEIPADAVAVMPDRIGYVQHVDLDALSDAAKSSGARVFVAALPGSFVHPARALAWLEAAAGESSMKQARSAFTVDDERSFDQDPRFGMCVLAEIASRALSPGLNDPGTAIDVIGRAVRVMLRWARGPTEDPHDALQHPQVWVPPVTVDELFDDIFMPIARDGAGLIEVQIRLQKALLALAQSGDPRFARSAERHSRVALERAEAALTIAGDLSILREVSDQIAHLAESSDDSVALEAETSAS
jgi:uncharacterized membrane protein